MSSERTKRDMAPESVIRRVREAQEMADQIASQTTAGSSGQMNESRNERSLRVLRGSTEKWQDQLVQSIQNSETGWHRLNVKLEAGGIATIQIIRDEQVSVD